MSNGSPVAVAADLGRGISKIVCNNQRVSFQSILGEARKTSFGGIMGEGVTLNGSAVVVEHPRYGTLVREVGKDALGQSDAHWSPRFREQRPEDLIPLLSQGLRELGVFGDTVLCVGTPAQFYDVQRGVAQELFQGKWVVAGSKVNVTQVVVLPQPVGAAWHLAVDGNGHIRPGGKEVIKGRVGILDIGEYTTDACVLDKMRYQAARVVTLEVGVGKLKEALAVYLTGRGYPVMPHQIDTALRARNVVLGGQKVDLESLIKEATALYIRPILTEVAAAWPDREEYDRIIVCGGGAYYFGQLIKNLWGDTVQVVGMPEWANVLGFAAFLKWSQR